MTTQVTFFAVCVVLLLTCLGTFCWKQGVLGNSVATPTVRPFPRGVTLCVCVLTFLGSVSPGGH